MFSMEKWHASQIQVAIDIAMHLANLIDQAESEADYLDWSAKCNAEAAAEKRAEMHELAELGENALYCINGSDLKWQQGVE